MTTTIPVTESPVHTFDVDVNHPGFIYINHNEQALAFTMPEADDILLWSMLHYSNYATIIPT
jgi:hypothetical protein